MAPDGSRQTRLTTARSGAESFQEPIWAPDGSAMMITAGRALEDESQGVEGIAFDIMALSADGSPGPRSRRRPTSTLRGTFLRTALAWPSAPNA